MHVDYTSKRKLTMILFHLKSNRICQKVTENIIFNVNRGFFTLYHTQLFVLLVDLNDGRNIPVVFDILHEVFTNRV